MRNKWSEQSSLCNIVPQLAIHVQSGNFLDQIGRIWRVELHAKLHQPRLFQLPSYFFIQPSKTSSISSKQRRVPDPLSLVVFQGNIQAKVFFLANVQRVAHQIEQLLPCRLLFDLEDLRLCAKDLDLDLFLHIFELDSSAAYDFQLIIWREERVRGFQVSTWSVTFGQQF